LKQFSHMKIIYSLFLIFVEKVIKLFSLVDFLQIRHIINNLILIEKEDKDKEEKEK